MRVCAGSVPDVDPGRHPESDGVNQRVDQLWNKLDTLFDIYCHACLADLIADS